VKRLLNLHLPGHSEIISYAFHNSGICSKHKIRDAFDHDKLKEDTLNVFTKLSYNLQIFKELKFNPLLWYKMNKNFVYSLLKIPSGKKVDFLNDREEL